jgi:tetratricopeptide (TPR) repeat protein
MLWQVQEVFPIASSRHSDRALRIKEYPFAHVGLGKTYYRLQQYYAALDEFRKVTDPSAETRCNIGLCYLKMGMYEYAEKEFSEALDRNPRLAPGYYNLAVLYYNENEEARAKALLRTCLINDRNFSKARDALKKLEVSGDVDWYGWWFGNGGGKKWLGAALVVSILVLMAVAAYESFLGSNLQSIAELVIILGVAVVWLLLPSLKKAKVGTIEIETALLGAKPPEIETVLV